MIRELLILLGFISEPVPFCDDCLVRHAHYEQDTTKRKRCVYCACKYEFLHQLPGQDVKNPDNAAGRELVMELQRLKDDLAGC